MDAWLWLLLPLSGSAHHELPGMIAWHGRIMVLAWGVLIPCGALLARYWKLWPGQTWPAKLDHKGWWHGHRALQYAGVALGTLGLVLAVLATGGWWWNRPASSLHILHALLGWLLMLAGWMQVISAWLRGSKGGPTDARMAGDHFDMTLRRQRFERIHKSIGWLALALALVVLLIGLVIADAPRWMPVALLLWWAGLGAMASRWQREGRCIDTYQAIWGTHPGLPGLRYPPIGWGIRRLPFAHNTYQGDNHDPSTVSIR